MVTPYPYLTWAPRDATGALPLLLCLHGSGECGTDLRRVARHGPIYEAEAGRKMPFRLIAPQAREEHWDPERISATLNDAIRRYPIDPRRVYATGYSMGADGVWAAAMHEPQRYAAIVTLCGGGDVRKVTRLVRLPIWNFHSKNDPVVSISESEELIRALRAAGAPEVHFTIYPDAGHNIWTRTYADSALYQWLLAHRKT